MLTYGKDVLIEDIKKIIKNKWKQQNEQKIAKNYETTKNKEYRKITKNLG